MKDHPVLIYDDNSPENIRSVILWTCALLVTGYLAFNVFLPNNDMTIGVSILQAVFATMVLVFYIGRATTAIITGSSLNTDYLIVGIVLSWVSTDGTAILAILARLSGFNPVLMNSELFAPLRLLSVIAAVLHVIPKGAADGTVPRGNTAVVGAFFVIAAVLATTVLIVRPDPMPIIERIPTFLRDFWQTGHVTVTEPPTPT